MLNHFAVYISNNDDKQALIKRLINGYFFSDFSSLNGLLFSEITLNKFINEEVRHGHNEIITDAKNTLKNSSSGERKKALLNHLISKKPEFLIVDNVFGNLDHANQKAIEDTLTQLSKKITIVQIANRKKEILPFITQVYTLKDDKLIDFEIFKSPKHIEKKSFNNKFPEPYKAIDIDFENLIQLNKVTVSYGERTILKNISWTIKPGEFWQLVGPNGSGKSTLINLITGDNPKGYLQDMTQFGIKKGSGESIWDIKKHVGYFSLEMLQGFKRRDTIENMIVSGFLDSIGLYKIPTERQIRIAQQWLHLLNMFQIRNKTFQSLSEGHKRLVLIARAMVKHPPLLILDEPTNGLDDTDTRIFIELVNKIAKESKTAILYVSHRKEEGLLNPDFIYELLAHKDGSIGKEIIE